jgi:hypothetical protein
MRDHRIPKLEVKKAAAKAYDDHIAAQLERTTWPLVHNYWRKGGTGRIFTHYPGSIFQQWWDNAWPVYADYRGGEKLARRQKIRKILFVLVLLVGGAWGGARAWAAGVPQRVVQGAFARGDALSSWVIRLVEGLPQRLRVQ